MKRSITAMLLAAGLAGCSGRPTTYLTLTPTPGATYPASGPPVAVAPVAMPPAIDRSYLTRASGANTLHVSSHARWAAPLGGAAQEVLARDLASRLPHRTVLMPGDPIPADALTVHVNVTSFLPRPGHVVLDADWRVIRGTGKADVAHGRSRIIAPAGGRAAQQAGAMSVTLGDLADTIARRLPR